MNDDHADGNKAFVCAFTEIGLGCSAATMVTLNVEGFVMDVTLADGTVKV